MTDEAQAIEPEDTALVLPEKHRGFYRRLRARVEGWVRRRGAGDRTVNTLLLAPDLFALLARLTVDPKVPGKEKAKIVAALAYFVSPMDLVPDLLLGPAGFVDDVLLAAYVIRSLLKSVPPEVVLRHWDGDADLLEFIGRLLATADRIAGARTLRRIRRMGG